MSERILRALMQLFAIIARVDGVTSSGRQIVQSFLKQQLNQELIDLYLAIFDEYVDSLHQVSSKKDGSAKRTSLNSVKILKICTQINSELTQEQKVVVLLRLIEFVFAGENINEQESEFLSTVYEAFNINEQEYIRCLNFVQANAETLPDSTSLLVVNNLTHHPYKKTKHLFHESMVDPLYVLHIESVNMVVFKFAGNGELYLNGQHIFPGRVYLLTPGSSVRSSKVKPLYYSDVITTFLSDANTTKITFSATNLYYKFKNGGIGLRNINLHEESGKLLGIMGGSGAGKSTLLNVLNGIEKPSEGKVLINGIDIHKEPHRIEGVIGHVSQDDLLIEELTVFQNLFYNTKLCYGNLSDEQITEKVHKVLSDIGLFEVKHLKVGSPLDKTISGGQRKRLNIALELIREPLVMFVDEPTSGLSSRDSENIMDLLKELALKGKLIFVVIHQPSSDIFKMFDRLVILDVGGYPIYYGNPVDAVIYFKRLVNHVNHNESECIECGNVNPEQIFNIIESKVLDEYGNVTKNRKVMPQEWNSYYIENIQQHLKPIIHLTEKPLTHFRIPTWIKQWRVFSKRDVLSKLTNNQYLIINLFEAPVLALLLSYLVKYFNADISNKAGYVFRENENLPAYLFMSVVVALFIGLTVSAEEIIRDRKILKRESFLNLSRSSYLVSKIAIMFVLSAIQTLLFVLVGNFMLQIKGMHADYWLILFTTSCFANMLGLNISSGFNSAVTIYILIPFLIIPQLLLSGVIVKFEKLNPSIASQNTVPFTGELMASRWAFEALAVNQFRSNAYENEFYIYDKTLSIADFKKNYLIPKLRAKLDAVEAGISDPRFSEQTANELNIIQKQVRKELAEVKSVQTNVVDYLTVEKFNPAIAAELKDYLNRLTNYYIKRYNQASVKKDEKIATLSAALNGTENFLQNRNAYENEALSDLVTNRNELSKILEAENQLIQRADPVFQDPKDSEFLSAHFFAPRKKLFGRYYDTFWINIGVIWFMSLFMMATLYFDLLHKIIERLSSFEFKWRARQAA